MQHIDEIRRRLHKAENDLDPRPEAAWAELMACVETAVRAVITECYAYLKDKNDVASLRKVEHEMGGLDRSYLNFGLGDLARLWRQAQVPKLWQRLSHHVPGIFRSFPFDEFCEERNAGIHHSRIPSPPTLKRLFYSTVELVNAAFPEDGLSAQRLESEARPSLVHNLPRMEQDFVGREDELRNIIQWLSGDSRVWLVSITGVGGVGKSALAVEVARRCLGETPLPAGIDAGNVRFDACVWTSAKEKEFVAGQVRSRASITSNLGAIASEILRVAGTGGHVQEGSEERQILLAKELLRSRRILLIVDNMETIDDEQVLAFLNELPQPSKAIITDRRSVQASHAIQLKEMSTEEAAQFVAEQSKPRGLCLSPSQIYSLVERTGGIPLAMIWALGLMAQADLGPDVVFRRLADLGGRPLLDFMFDESFSRASENARKILAACSLTGYPVRGNLLADWVSLSAAEAEDALGELRSIALIRAYSIDDAALSATLQRRFEVLPLTRDFLRSAYPEWVSDSLRCHVTRRIIDVIMEREQNLSWPSISTIDAIDTQRNLILWAAQDAFDRHDDKVVFDAIRISGHALGIRGYHLQRLQLALLALQAAERCSDDQMMALCLVLNIAWVHFGWYNFDESERAARHGLDAAKRCRDRSLEGSAIRLLGLIAKERADRLEPETSERNQLHFEAAVKLEEARNIFEEEHNLALIAITDGALGSLLRDMGQLAEAEVAMLRAKVVAKNLVNGEEIQTILCQKLSRLLAQQDDRLNEAETYNKEAMSILARLRRPVGVAHCKLNQALIEEKRNAMLAAVAYAEEAERIFIRAGAKQDVELVLNRLRQKAQMLPTEA